MILKVRRIGLQMVGMGEHLHTLVLSQVEGGVLIHTLRLTVTQVLHHHIQGLLVVLHQLWL